MSEINNGSAVDQQVDVSQVEKEQVVSKKAYEEVSRDMHKNKQKAKELEAQLNELTTQLKVQEEAKMLEEKRYKELYEKTQAEIEEERRRATEKEQQYMRSVKVSALQQELGGNINSKYLSFANLDSVSIKDDGSVDSESLREVANEFRKEHGQLIPKSDNTQITGHSPSNLDNFNPKSVNEMSHEEKVELLREIQANKK